MTKASNETRIARDFELLETMEGGLRSVVHEFGFEIVNACRVYGVTKPHHIRHLVHEIWAGARQPMQSVAKRKGAQSRALNNLDWVLLQAGSQVSAARLIRVMDTNGLQVVGQSVLPAMVNASMSAIDGMGLLSKRRKHEIRLQEALKVGRKWVLREMDSEA
jgi:hypothetical protein